MNGNINKLTLGENWYIAFDKDNNGIEKAWNRYIPCDAVKTKVPSIIQETLPDCHGVVFYFCKFTPEMFLLEKGRLILYFHAADYKAQVYLNGEYLGCHEGGETPFSFDVTDNIRLNAENLLSVRIVNPTEIDIDGINICNVPSRNKVTKPVAGSCLNHGGLWGEVELISLPAVYIDDVYLVGDISTKTLKAKLNIKNTSLRDIPFTVSLNVYERLGAKNRVVAKKVSFRAESESFESEIDIALPEIKLWDIDDPYLYNVEVNIISEYGRHRILESFGFREFLVKDGYFYLNGRKIFLKSSHTGNAFPVGQGYPAIKEQIRKDMIMAKSYGFNMVRSIAGMLREEQLKVCDEIGLMVYEENYAAWNLGEKLHLLKEGEKALGDIDLMLKRFDLCTMEMIKRDRNHPSVTIWGLLNEMNPERAVTPHAVEFLPKLREMDETRLVMLNSGRWDKYLNIASASNPYSHTWDAKMGGDLSGDLTKEEARDNIGLDGGGDLHIYPRYPLDKSFENYVRNYAKGYIPAFFSETGMSGLFNVIEESKHFEQYGYSENLEDYKWIKSQSDKLERDWERLGLQNIYPFPEMMLKESQRLSAEDRRRIFDMIRSNPKFNGYSLTGLLDHGWCGEGLWSLWRRFKPEVYEAVCDGFAPLRFCLFSKNHVYSGESFEIEAVLSNECVLKEGIYEANFAIIGEMGTIEMWNEKFEIIDDSFAVPVMKRAITLNVPSGKYSLLAYMKGASPLGNKLDFFVTNRNDIKCKTDKITVLGLEESTCKYLEDKGIKLHKFENKGEKFILAGKNLTYNDVESLINASENGSKVLFINSGAFCGESMNALKTDDIKLQGMWNWLYHQENLLVNKEVFKGLGTGLLNQKIFGQTLKEKCFEVNITPKDVIAPAFYTGYHGFNGSYGLRYNAFGIEKGEGMLYFSSFLVEENLGDEPAAEILLNNFINYLA